MQFTLVGLPEEDNEKDKTKMTSWYKIVALVLSFPSTILGLAWLIQALIKEDVFSKNIGWGFFIFIITGMLVLLLWYSYKNRNKT